jgi:hypothetical protein
MGPGVVMFYLGTHEVSWLGKAGVPLMVSHRRLAKRKSLPRAIAPWVLDSGGFSELSLFGEWRTTLPQYVEAVKRYQTDVGELVWAAPMDWMCEPWIIDKTGLSVREHQERTVQNYLDLDTAWGVANNPPFIPVLQGWTLDDYLACLKLYDEAGVGGPLFGLGSVCRRQDTLEIEIITSALKAPHTINLHGFGVKRKGLERYARHLESVDSLAWSFNARKNPPLPGHTHKSCANCLEYALLWRAKVERSLEYVHVPLFEEVA